MASPDPPPTPSRAPREGPPDSPDARREALRRAERARQAFVTPWSRQRARRVGIVAVVLGVLGPLIGTAVALVLVPAQPGDVLELDDGRTSVIDARGTVRGMDTSTGELVFRLVITRSEDAAAEESGLFAADGTLTEDLTLLVNDVTGQSVHVLPAGAPPGTVTVTLDLTDSRATRYPVDRYRTTAFVVARRDATTAPDEADADADSSDDGATTADGDDGATEDDGTDGAGATGTEVVPLRLSLRSSDPGFSVDVVDDASTDEAAVVELRITRRATVIGWAAFFVLVCWLLAISAGSIGWTTVVHGIATPVWAWGFLIGVLFALPPLRNALPGAPPAGSLVDLAAFYWAVGIVALTLVAMIGSWNIRVRRAPHDPDAPKPTV